MCSDLRVFWVTALAEFGEDQDAVHAHLKTAPGARDQGEAGDAGVVLLENRFRQTGGFGEVVSSGAVLDADLFGHRDVLL
jgi:hypothetical protein